MNRQYQFARMYYDWIIDCLTEDEKWEELAFFRLGVDLCVRLSDLKRIKWSQIEYPYVNDVKVLKLKRDENTDKNYTAENHFIEKVEITAQTFNTLNAIRGDARDDDFVFNRAQYILIESISASIGTNFNGHEIRNIGTIFKTAIILE